MLENKKIANVFICVGLIAIVAAVIVSSVIPKRDYKTNFSPALDEAVALSAFSRENVSVSDITVDGETLRYAAVRDSETLLDTECLGEGHVILGFSEKSGGLDVYALCSSIGYGFRDGALVDSTGSFCIPTVLTFNKADGGKYVFKEAKEAEDGSYFTDSVKKMFPAALARKAIDAQGDEEIYRSLHSQCDAYAAAYLKAIGREAKISTYHDEDYPLLSDLGVSADVENQLYGLHPEYGFYTGSSEKIENSIRYVYTLEWKGDENGNGTVTYTKSEYESGKAVEKFTYSVKGDSFTEVKPKKKKK